MTRDAKQAISAPLNIMSILQEDRELIAAYIEREVAEGNDKPIARTDVAQILSNIAGAIRSGEASEC